VSFKDEGYLHIYDPTISSSSFIPFPTLETDFMSMLLLPPFSRNLQKRALFCKKWMTLSNVSLW
jgi:UPF0716 family protein affecting phage T7 exclusion